MRLPGSIRHAVLALSVALVAGAGVTPAQVQSAATILGKAKQATGGTAWDSVRTLYIRSKVESAGLLGISEEWDDVLTGRYESSQKLSVLMGAEAFDGKVIWARDETGQLREVGDRASREAAVNTAFRISLSYWFTDRIKSKMEYTGERREGTKEFEIIRITPTGGSAFELWIDNENSLIERVMEKIPSGMRTTYYMDYRLVDGVKIPFLIRSATTPGNYVKTTRVQRVLVNPPLKPTKFRLSQTARRDFSIIGGKAAVTIPFNLDNNFIYLAVRMNGQGPFRALLDTGGAATLSFAFAKRLGLTPRGAFEVVGAGESSVSVGFVKVKSFQIGDARFMNQVFGVYPGGEGQPDIILGYEVFKRFVVTLDYKHQLLALTLPDQFDYKGVGTVVPFRFNDRMPEVDGSVDGIPAIFTVDTGANSALILTSPFVTEHNLLTALQLKPGMEMQGSGIGGQYRLLVAQVKLLTLGGIQIRELPALLSLAKTGSHANPYIAGSVGGGIIKRFTVIFDYIRQQIIFEKQN